MSCVQKEHTGVLKAEPSDNQALSVPIAAAGVMQGQLSCVGGPHAEACALNSALIASQRSVPSKGGPESVLLTLDTAGALRFFRPQKTFDELKRVSKTSGERVSKQILKRWIEGVYLA